MSLPHGCLAQPRELGRVAARTGYAKRCAQYWLLVAVLVAGALASAGSWHSVSGQAGAGQAASGRYAMIDDLLELREFDALALSSDGRWAAYTMRPVFSPSAVVDTGLPTERIVILDLRRHRQRMVRVRGHPHDLRWSSVGSTLAFIAPSNGRDRIWRYAPLGTEPLPRWVASRDSLDGDILAFAWSVTGEEIAYLAVEPGTARRLPGALRVPPRVVIFNDSPGDYTGPTSTTYSRDSTGAYLAIVSAAGGPARTIARHVISVKYKPALEWSRTGKLLISGAPIGVAWIDQLIQRPLYVLDPAIGTLRQVRADRKAQLSPTWSPSGQWIAAVDYESFVDGEPAAFGLRLENITRSTGSSLSRGVDDPSSSLLAPMWSNDDRTVYVVQPVDGTNRLFAVDVASHKWRVMTPDSLSVSQYAVSRNGMSLLGVLESATQPPEIFQIDPATGALTRLTHTSDALPAMHLGRVWQVSWRSSDSRFMVHGFLITPPDYDSTRRYPLVVMAHGGPGALYMNTFTGVNFPPSLIPPQLLAAAGFLVLLPNPRGDPSYGSAFQGAIRGAWGAGPFADVSTGISMVVTQGLADSTALGIAGASYGGYLAAFAITHSRRFAAASIDDAPVDLVSEYGQNYATRAPWRSYFGGTPWKEHGLYASQSPITHVQDVRTPVLMRYGGRSDTRDNIRQAYMLAQGFEFYAGLRDGGVPVRFVLHPDQGHGIADWELYKDWVGENLRWFRYWLRREGDDPSVMPR